MRPDYYTDYPGSGGGYRPSSGYRPAPGGSTTAKQIILICTSVLCVITFFLPWLNDRLLRLLKYEISSYISISDGGISIVSPIGFCGFLFRVGWEINNLASYFGSDSAEAIQIFAVSIVLALSLLAYIGLAIYSIIKILSGRKTMAIGQTVIYVLLFLCVFCVMIYLNNEIGYGLFSPIQLMASPIIGLVLQIGTLVALIAIPDAPRAAYPRDVRSARPVYGGAPYGGAPRGGAPYGGAPRGPVVSPSGEWTCSCGKAGLTTAFCSQCGRKRPAGGGTGSATPMGGTPAGGTPMSTPAGGTPMSTPVGGTPMSTPAGGVLKTTCKRCGAPTKPGKQLCPDCESIVTIVDSPDPSPEPESPAPAESKEGGRIKMKM